MKIVTHKFLLIAALLLAWPCRAQSPSEAIDDLVRPHAEAGLFSGVILISQGDATQIELAYGLANWEQQAPVTSSTRFGIGSISKPMTVNIAEALLAADTIELDDSVNRYIPGFPAGPDGAEVSIDHLINHRSGVPHRVTSAADETQVRSAAQLVDRVIGQGLLFSPGSERLYSSAGYTVLARVLEVAAGRTFDALIDEFVFEPAGMPDARPETGERIMDRRALPYRLGAEDGRIAVRNTPHKDLRFLTGAGSVYATGNDMLAYANALRDGNFGDRARDDLLGDDPAAWVGIYGRTNGYEASIDVLQSENLVFVMLTNLQSATTGQVRMGVRDILTRSDVAAIPMPPPVADRSEPPAEIVGIYGRAEIHALDEALFRGENEFYPTDSGYYIPGSGTRMTFRRNRSGTVDALISTSLSGRETVLPRTLP